MMLFLVLNVSFHVLDRGRAYRKSTVPFLPFKHSSNFPVNPHRGFAFQIAQEIVEAVFRFQTYEQMNMLFDSVDLQRNGVQTSYDAAQVRVQTLFPFWQDQSTTVFG